MLIKDMEKAFEDNKKIKGHLYYLDDARLVFLGKHEYYKDDWYLGFRNSEGEDTRLRLTREAMTALVHLYGKVWKGDDIFPLRFRKTFEVIIKEEVDETPSNGS